MTDNLVPRSQRSWIKCNVTSAQKDSLNLTDKLRDVLPSAMKIDKNYFFLGFRLVINEPNHHSLSLILGFAVTVTIWPREVVSGRDFILRSVTTFWVMSLFGIYHWQGLIIQLIRSFATICSGYEWIHLHLVEFQCTEKQFCQKLLAISQDQLLGWILALIFVRMARTYSRINTVSDFWGQFNKTITSVAIVLEAEYK